MYLSVLFRGLIKIRGLMVFKFLEVLILKVVKN